MLTDEALVLQAEARAADAAHARYARLDPNAFCEYVLRSEEDGSPIVQARMHEEWHDLLDEHRQVVLWAHVEGGKSQQISVGRVLYELGRNPNLRVAVVSNTQPQAIKIVRQLKTYIEQSDELHRVFPELQPGRGDTWGETAFTVKRKTIAKDPSVQAFGIGSAQLGSRIDLLILDDVLRWQNTLTPKRMEDLRRSVYSELFGRLTRNARVWVLGNAYHPDDLLHYFEKQPGWVARRYPVIDERGNAVWADAWPPERIEAKRVQLGPHEFARQMLCIPRDDSAAVFKREWIDKALKKGEGRAQAYRITHVPNGCATITGVDLAVQKKKKSDSTSIATLLLHPNQDRELLMLETAKLHGPEIVEKIIETHERYFSITYVEDNAAQDYILQFARATSAVPVKPFHTGPNKLDPQFGIESLATELANDKWIFPSENGQAATEEVSRLIEDMLFYDRQGHTGDRLMAVWIAREGTRDLPPPPKVIRQRNLDLLRR